MYADAVALLAVVLFVAWSAVALNAAAARRGCTPRYAGDSRLLTAGAVAVLLFGGQAALADYIDDAGQGPTPYDLAVWATALGHRDAVATAVAAALRVAGGTVALTVLAASATGVLLILGHRLEAALVVSTPFVSSLVVGTVKAGYGRPRPPAAGQLIPEAGFSLPSGHTMDATVVLGVLALVVVSRLDDRAHRLLVGLAVTVVVTAAGAARVYLGVHWATDVFAGWLLGAAWVALCAVALLVNERETAADQPSVLARRGDEERRPRRPRAPACSGGGQRASHRPHRRGDVGGRTRRA